MNKVLLTFLTFLPISYSFAQNCTPNPAYQDSTGVFPMPYEPDLSPEGGISECAVIGENYDFSFTVGVGDSITINQNGFEITLELEKITINSVSGLPVGVNVVYEPSNAVFPASSIGCAKLTGIPTMANPPGEYDLNISATISFTSPLIPDRDVNFPDPQFAPGKYTLVLLANAGEMCTAVSTKEQVANKVKMSIQPNPTQGLFNVGVTAEVSGEFNLYLVDIIGQVVQSNVVKLQQGGNSVEIDGSMLNNGLYYLVLENELGRVTQKMIIQH